MKQIIPKYSLIVTCYFEEKSIAEFYSRSKAVLDVLDVTYEIIFINDGSTDQTIECLESIFEYDQHVTHVIDFTRNFGQNAAFTAGLSVASGERILYLDSDLQLDPEDIPLLIAQYEKGFDIVKGKRVGRDDPLIRKVCSYCANIMVRKSTADAVQDVGCSFTLFARSLTDQFDFGPYNVYSKMKILKYSNRVCEVAVNQHKRKYGKSGQSFLKLWTMNINNLICLSDKPFQYIAMGTIFIAFVVFVRIILGFIVDGKIFNSVSNGLLLNVIVMFSLSTLGVMCLVGEFCIRTFLLAEKSPKYIIRSIRSQGLTKNIL